MTAGDYAGRIVSVNSPLTGAVTISGVKYPRLFPSYVFTFKDMEPAAAS